MGLSIDREKVIKGLECCTNGEICISDCPYFKESTMTDGRCITLLQADALVLLKEQETANTGRCRIFQCKKCGFGFDDIFVNDESKYPLVPRYCQNCGRKVKGNE